MLRTIFTNILTDYVFRAALLLFTISIVVSAFLDDSLDWKSAFIIGAIPFVLSMTFTLIGYALTEGVITHIRDNKTQSGQVIALIAAAALIGKQAHKEAVEKTNGNK